MAADQFQAGAPGKSGSTQTSVEYFDVFLYRKLAKRRGRDDFVPTAIGVSGGDSRPRGKMTPRTRRFSILSSGGSCLVVQHENGKNRSTLAKPRFEMARIGAILTPIFEKKKKRSDFLVLALVSPTFDIINDTNYSNAIHT